MAPRAYIGLLRAIGPATHAVMPMAALRRACEEAGLVDVATVLATGNLVFRAEGRRADVLERVQSVVAGFGLANAVLLRTPAELAEIGAANPFPDAAAERPQSLIVCFLAKSPPDSGWVGEHRGPERLQLDGASLFVDYAGGITGSKLPPGRIEKRLGVTMTFRNWNTLLKLMAVTGPR